MSSNMAIEQSTGNKSDFIIVGCKLPHGYRAEIVPPVREAPDGQVRSPAPTGPFHIFNGANSAASTAALGGNIIRVNPRILNYGRTAIPRDFWERWSKQETAKALIDKGFVFAETRENEFKAHAREKLPEKTGLEGLSPEGDDERMEAVRIPGQPETVVETDKDHLRKLQKELSDAA
jgi:hypothetical protein